MRQTVLILLAVLAFVFTACEDMLDVRPKNSLTFANAFDSEKDVESAIRSAERASRGMHSEFPTSPGARGMYSDFYRAGSSELLSDEAAQGVLTGWQGNYQCMTYANVALPYIDGIKMSQGQKDFYRGQIYFFKAFAYLDLIQGWGDCVLVQEEVDLAPAAKTSWVLVADYAIELAKGATRLLPEYGKGVDSQGNVIVRKSVPMQGSAYALLAYLSAWKAGCKYLAPVEYRNYDEMEYWRIADTACTRVIESSVYELARTPELVCQDVLVGGSRESVYESSFRNFIDEFDFPTESFLNAYRYQGWPIVLGQGAGSIKNKANRILASTVYQMYPAEYEPTGDSVVDLRRNAYFYKVDSMANPILLPTTGGYVYPQKWRVIKVGDDGWGSQGFINYDQNKIWWRLADVILLRAECRARLGNKAGAIADLNQIRDRAGIGHYRETEHGGDLRYTIYKERERELLMEEFRYFDIVRNGYVRQELMGKHKTLSDQDMIDGALFNAVDLDEFSKNPKMTQNVYWKARL